MKISVGKSDSEHLLRICTFVFLLLAGCDNFTEDTLSGDPPVTEMRLVRRNGGLFEAWVHVEKGVRLDSLVDISYFDGFAYTNGLDVARRRFGEPHTVRVQPDMGGHLEIHLYPVPEGEIGFIEVPSSGGKQSQVWAIPANQSPDAVILDASLRAQLLRHLPGDRSVRVHLLRDIGWGGITLSMNRDRVDYLILGPRDEEN